MDKWIDYNEFKTLNEFMMDKQLQYKIIHLTHQRDELLYRLQDLAEDLNYIDIKQIVYDITKYNRTIKKLIASE